MTLWNKRAVQKFATLMSHNVQLKAVVNINDKPLIVKLNRPNTIRK